MKANDVMYCSLTETPQMAISVFYLQMCWASIGVGITVIFSCFILSFFLSFFLFFFHPTPLFPSYDLLTLWPVFVLTILFLSYSCIFWQRASACSMALWEIYSHTLLVKVWSAPNITTLRTTVSILEVFVG